jgi:hypothetical protein
MGRACGALRQPPITRRYNAPALPRGDADAGRDPATQRRARHGSLKPDRCSLHPTRSPVKKLTHTLGTLRHQSHIHGYRPAR